ncbi:MAG: DegT/DnrJ/EryC1/StrS family aminotransferase [Jatrophihabitans sp.]|uniref:DegT/DnrJ/EryC1/StrS family aminotransferase n=1 Tax=Jatrophihabitans sp. TaxID=1932789 RepID=UPI003911382D
MIAPAAVDTTVPFLDLSAVTRVVRHAVLESWSGLLERNRYVGGEAVEQFESDWAAYCGTDFAVGVANGTDAIHLTLRALGIGPGDEVVLPTNTFVATAEAVVLAGAVPRFADVSADTLLLTADAVERALTRRTCAVIAVHLYGQPADMDALAAVAARNNLVLIEDAAQAHGARWRGKRAGSLARAGCFSFYPGKNLGAFGDAGAVVTSDRELDQRLRSLRDHGRRAGTHYDHAFMGTNSRLDALQAVVLAAKLPHLDAWNAMRRQIAGRYRSAFGAAGVPLVHEAEGASGVHHLAVARVADRERARRLLATHGIESAIHYPTPCHLAEPYARFARDPLPVAERAAGEVLSLPMFPHMSTAQVSRVCAAMQLVAGPDSALPSIAHFAEATHA